MFRTPIKMCMYISQPSDAMTTGSSWKLFSILPQLLLKSPLLNYYTAKIVSLFSEDLRSELSICNLKSVKVIDVESEYYVRDIWCV